MAKDVLQVVARLDRLFFALPVLQPAFRWQISKGDGGEKTFCVGARRRSRLDKRRSPSINDILVRQVDRYVHVFIIHCSLTFILPPAIPNFLSLLNVPSAVPDNVNKASRQNHGQQRSFMHAVSDHSYLSSNRANISRPL